MRIRYLVEDLDKEVDRLEARELVVVDVNAEGEEEASVAPGLGSFGFGVWVWFERMWVKNRARHGAWFSLNQPATSPSVWFSA